MVTAEEKNKIFVTLNGKFKDKEQCRVAMETIVNDAHAAYGVNSHFWFQSDDGTSLFVLEQYEDKKALSQAIRRFTKARVSFFRSITDFDIALYGNVSFGSKLMFAAFRPQYMDYFGGYAKGVAKTEEPGIKAFERERVIVATSVEVRNEQKCRAAMETIAKTAHAKDGVKSHFWCKSKDGKSLQILEQYEDETAFLEHAVTSQNLGADFVDSSRITDVRIYGAVSEQAKEMFAALEPRLMRYFGGYSK